MDANFLADGDRHVARRRGGTVIKRTVPRARRQCTPTYVGAGRVSVRKNITRFHPDM